MARLEITTRNGWTLVSVTLSRRNLFALLHKLELPGPARTLVNDDCWLNGEQTPLGTMQLQLQCEEDDEREPPRPDAVSGVRSPKSVTRGRSALGPTAIVGLADGTTTPSRRGYPAARCRTRY